LINREFYFDGSHEQYNNRGPQQQRKKQKDSRPCPSNDGRLLVWDKQQEYWICPSCGYHTQKTHFDPVLEKIGAVSIVTADGFGGDGGNDDNNTAEHASKPMIRSKFKSRNSESLENYRKTAEIKGDAELEEWLKKQSPGTHLVAYRDSTTQQQ